MYNSLQYFNKGVSLLTVFANLTSGIHNAHTTWAHSPRSVCLNAPQLLGHNTQSTMQDGEWRHRLNIIYQHNGIMDMFLIQNNNFTSYTQHLQKKIKKFRICKNYEIALPYFISVSNNKQK